MILSLFQTDDFVQIGLGMLIVGLFPVGVVIMWFNRRWPPVFAVVSCVLMTAIVGMSAAFIAVFETLRF